MYNKWKIKEELDNGEVHNDWNENYGKHIMIKTIYGSNG